MEQYKNLSGNSGVVAFQIGNDYIKVQFKDGRFTLYTYTYQSASSVAIENMKALAVRGQGLNSYISTNKPQYSSKV